MRVMRSTLVPMLLDYAASDGCDGELLADRLGIPEQSRTIKTWTMDAPSLPVDLVVHLAAEVASAASDPQLGLHMAEAVPRGTYGVQEFAFRNASTLGHAATRLLRYQRLTSDTLSNFAGRSGPSSWIGFRIPGRPDGLGPHLDTFLQMLRLRFIRELSGKPLCPLRVEFAHARPDNGTDVLAAAFGCRELTFGAGQCLLAFDAAVWDIPVEHADPTLLPVLEAYARQLMPMEATATSWRSQARDYLRRQLSEGAPKLDQCAAALGVTPRTLQRRLREESSATYRQIVDELREEEARRLLATTDVTIDEVSFLLGFSERRAFVRAFVRWTGSTPGKYRQKAR